MKNKITPVNGKCLCLIPGREGSKGIPGKNLKPLNGVPLVDYTLQVARQVFDDDDICISTDWLELKEHVERSGVPVPFLRPTELAGDSVGTYEVLLHALDFYATKGIHYDCVVLLQITSPFRTAGDLYRALQLMDKETDAVIAVKQASANPYYVLYEEDDSTGFLRKSKEGDFTRRQDCPEVYEINGAVYVFDVKALRKSFLGQMKRLKKFVMSEERSIDLDTPMDWTIAECLLRAGYIK